MDRQDIDALLIGALYGELTPADEARLAAHFEAHPADRGALESLTRTRQTVVDSRLAAIQHEPPQAISALLLQEAHRQAPRRVADHASAAAGESWFYRFTRSFLAHPAMAAAAMLVLVLGGAGILYLKTGDDQFMTMQARSMSEPAPESAQAEASDEKADEPYEALAAAAEQGRPPRDEAERSDGLATMKAELYEPGGARPAAAAEAPSSALAADDRASSPPARASGVVSKMAPGKKAAAAGAGKKAELAEALGVAEATLERRRAVMPAGAGAGAAPRVGDVVSKDTAADAEGGGSTRQVADRASRTTFAPPPPPPPPPALPEKASSARATSTSSGPTKAAPFAAPVAAAAEPTSAALPAKAVPAKAPPQTTKAKAPAGTPDPSAFSERSVAASPSAAPSGAADWAQPRGIRRSEAVSDDVSSDADGMLEAEAPGSEGREPASAGRAPASSKVSKGAARNVTDAPDLALVAWAKAAHQRAVALARQKNCAAAAKIAFDVSRRASAYYAQQMANDRALAPCSAYIALERERATSKTRSAAPQPAEAK